MSRFVQTTDFLTGEIIVSQTTNTTKSLQIIIDKLEVNVLQELFGSELYKLFIDDLVNNVPQDPRFIAVFDAFYNDDDVSNSFGCWCGGAFRSEGIKKMLMWLIYWSFAKDQAFQNASVGTVRNEEENSTIVNGSAYGLNIKYNEGVRSYQAIARLMIDDLTTYPEYNGIAKEKILAVL